MLKFKSAAVVLMICSAFTIKAQSVDDIVSKSLSAKGGIEKIKALQSQRLTGQIWLGGGGSANPFVASLERPGKIRVEIVINNQNILQINNGTEGWVINPFSGSDAPVAMTDDEFKNTSSSADLDGPLVDYKEGKNKIELLGIENVEGKPAYKLFVKQANGQTRYDYIDSASYLEVKWEGNIMNNGKENPSESLFHNYKSVEGIMYSFEIISDSPGGTNKQKITFDKIEVNPKLDGSTFNQPGKTSQGSTKN